MDRLREYMSDQGLTQSELAKRFEVSQATISDWLSGKTMPKPSRLVTISRKTGISVDALLGATH